MHGLLITDYSSAQAPVTHTQSKGRTQFSTIQTRLPRQIGKDDWSGAEAKTRFLVCDLIDRFYDESIVIHNRSRYTIGWYKRTVGKMFELHPEREFLDQWNQQFVETYLYEGRRKKKWKVSTFINVFGGICSFFAWCERKEFIPENFVTKIEKPRREKHLPKALSKTNADSILEASFYAQYTYRFERYRNRALIAVMLYAGLRIREVLELGSMAVDLENGSIHIVQGKHHKDRIIPIAPRLNGYLKAYLVERRRLNKTHRYFFSSTNRDKPMTYGGVCKAIKRIKDRSGIYFTPHILRHTFATLMLEGGCDIFSLSKMLGHQDIKTTTIYLSASPQHLRQQIYKHPLN
ncbi:MAG: tyrosine-type recombinase/integrase [Bacteroidota bacterium]